MLVIKGKTLVTTDWHWGLKNNQNSRLRILSDVSKKITKYVEENGIKNIIFCGDWLHQRTNCSVQVLNVAYKHLELLTKRANFYFIVGNHDIFMKDSCDINSAVLFKDIKNVTIITKPTECMINDKKALFCPWLSDLSQYKKSQFDMLFGHFDMSQEYLLASYVENNISKNESNEEIMNAINKEEFFRDTGLEDMNFDNEDLKDSIINHKESSELVGDWVDIVKSKGVIFSGHIHQHKEFFTKNRKFIFVGSPYQQTRGEMDSEDGFYTLSESNKVEFHKLEGIPIHVDLDISRIAENIDGFDFSVVKNNIILRKYRKEVDRVLDAKIVQKIIDNRPYEELQPSYDIIVSYDSKDGKMINESLDSIKKSKLEYINSYINNIDDKTMKDNDIEKDKLMDVMKEFYERVSD